ncbi:endonuclease domain-containing protein [Anatilimnocola floriformis]|uniref:endonuclease domain-containing protein n=1 Tax=Anatilimnocola floriformis TaxID=2948575 RepID=UPI0021BC9718|nr:DUF559 domain-containing protein [Anatilimnocola floriformis]
MRHRPRNGALFNERAREMRQAPNDAEAAIWHLLRDRKLGGFKFRRQHPLGNYIADFFCPDAGLVVELDGKSHQGKEEADAARQAWFVERGFAVIRYTNHDVNENAEGVAELIWQKCIELVGLGGRSETQI